VGGQNPAGDAVTRRIRARIGQQRAEQPPGPEQEWAAEADWPPEELLALHDRHDVSGLDVRVRNRLLGPLLTPIRRLMLRPVVDLAARQSEINALSARVLSELANRAARLQASETARRSEEAALRALRQRVAALEAELREIRALATRRHDA
jgi:hypothetical protein